MTLSGSIRAYDDCRVALDRALQSEHGALVGPFPSVRAAKNFIFRACYFRRLARDENKKLYDEHHSMWGCSVYDNLVLRLKDTTVVITPYKFPKGAVVTDIATGEQFEFDPKTSELVKRSS